MAKTCPLKMLEYNEDTKEYNGMPCTEEHCGWWCKIKNCCAIVAIANKQESR